MAKYKISIRPNLLINFGTNGAVQKLAKANILINKPKINHIELTEELEQQITESLRTNKVFYWPDDYEQPVIDEIKSLNDYTR